MKSRFLNITLLVIAVALFAIISYINNGNPAKEFDKTIGKHNVLSPLEVETSEATPSKEPQSPPTRERLDLCDRLIRDYPQVGESTDIPYTPRRDQTDFRLVSGTAPGELVRRIRFLKAVDLKYPLIRVDEIIVQTPGFPEKRLAALASIADHLITRITEEAGIESIRSELPEGFEIRKSMSSKDLFLISFPLVGHRSEAEAIAALESIDGTFIHAEPDFIVSSAALPDDTRTSELYAFQNTGQGGGLPGADISAAEAWDVATGDGSVTIAIIDSGIDPDHPDLAPRLFINPGESGDGRETNGIDDDGNGFVDDVSGWDFFADDRDPRDEYFHGTHVAGTAGAAGNNGIGVSGVCWDVRLLNLRFIDATNNGMTSDVIDAVNYATDIGADITNNSWSGIGISIELRTAIRRGGDAGILFIAAAGNKGQDSDEIPRYPASYPSEYVVSVAATDNLDQLGSFSNRGRRSVDIAAPGVGILSTFPTYRTREMDFARFSSDYEVISGTSMACPMVAGAAALLKMHRPDIGVLALREALLSSVDPRAALAETTASGGRLNLATLLSPFSRAGERQSQVAAGENHFLWLNPDGTVLIWGDGNPTANIVPGLSGIIEVAAGKNFSVALSERGNVFTFGEAGGSGQMGNGFLTGNREPGLVQGLPEIAQIAVGTAHVLALSRTGEVWAWGRGVFGILGNGGEDLSAIPVKVSNLDDAVFVSAGSYHNLAIREDGTVASWGYNGTGALGDGTTVNRSTPVTALGLTGITHVSAGRGSLAPGADPGLFGGHSLAVADDGEVFSFGNNRFGELGRPSVSGGSSVALPVPDLQNITSASAGQWVSYAVDTSGELV